MPPIPFVHLSFVLDPATPDPTDAAALAELTALGLGMARAVATLAEAERRIAAAACHWLPAADAEPASLEQARQVGLGIDAADEAVAKANPRLATLTGCFERIARAVRRTVALRRRLEHGWPRRVCDDRRALLVRQAARTTRETIRVRTHGDEEAAERFFADLDARLDDPAFKRDLLERSVAEMVRLLCRAIGLEDEATERGRFDSPVEFARDDALKK